MLERLTAQRLLAVFAGGCALLNYPLLLLWNVDVQLMGVSLLPLALFVLWGGLIAALAWLLEREEGAEVLGSGSPP